MAGAPEELLRLDGVGLAYPAGARVAARAAAGRADLVLEPRRDVRITVSWGPLDESRYKTLETFADGAVSGLKSKLRRCSVSDRRESSVNGHPTIEQRLEESRRGLGGDRRALAVNFFCPVSDRYFGLLLIARAEPFVQAWDEFRSTLASLRCHD